MSENNDFALVPSAPNSVEKAQPCAKRVLAGMVADTLALGHAKVAAQSLSALQPGAGAAAQKWYQEGQRYFYGRGVPTDCAAAAKLFRLAAEQNHADAQVTLGACYEYGQGLEKDYTEAVKWYRKAAEHNDQTAQICLGICYAEGKGVEKDFVEAVKWYREAAEQHISGWAQYELGLCYAKGQGVQKDYREAVEWYLESAGYPAAEYELGLCYENGWGVEKDYAEAAKSFRKAAEQGHLAAQQSLGACYANGRIAIDIASGMEGAIDAYQYVKLAEEKGCEGAAKTVDVISALLSPEELCEAEHRYQELCSRRHES